MFRCVGSPWWGVPKHEDPIRSIVMRKRSSDGVYPIPCPLPQVPNTKKSTQAQNEHTKIKVRFGAVRPF